MIFLITFFSCSQSFPASIEHLNRADGLSHSGVNTLHFDSEGILWVGTEEEVNWYVGGRFRELQPTNVALASKLVNVSFIFNDAQKGVWFFNSFQGIYRLDKTNWVLQTLPVLSSSKNSSSLKGTAYLVDTLQRIWIGGDEGIFQYTLDSKKLEPIPIPSSHSDVKLKVNCIYETPDGSILVGTGKGIFIYDKDLKRFSPFNPEYFDDKDIEKLDVKNGQLWVFSVVGLDRLDLSTKELKTIATAGNYTPYEFFNDFFIGEDNTIWIAASSGIIQLSTSGTKTSHIQHGLSGKASFPHMTTGVHELDGKLYFVLLGALASYNQESDSFDYYEFDPAIQEGAAAHNWAYKYLKADSSNNLWIADSTGITKVSFNRPSFKYYLFQSSTDKGINSNLSRAILRDSKDRLWIGSQDKGLSRYEPKLHQWQYFSSNIKDKKSINYNHVRALVEDSEKNIWAGTDGGGLNSYNSAQDSWSSHRVGERSQEIFALHLEDNQSLWIGHGVGLSKFDINSKEYKKHVDLTTGANPPMVRAIDQDKNGSLWLGTHPSSHFIGPRSGGLYRYEEEQNHWERFGHDSGDPNSLSNDHVFAVKVDQKQDVWVGTWGGGLSLLHRGTNNFTHYTKDDGLLSNIIYAIIEDNDGVLWLSSPKGITRFEPCHRQQSSLNYTCTPVVKTHLLSDLYPQIELDSESFHFDGNSVFFGGKKGVVSFAPKKRYETNKFKPTKTFIVSLLVNGEPIAPSTKGILNQWINYTHEIVLDNAQTTVSLELANNEYTAPQRNRFRFRLNQKKWNYLPPGKRQITFGKLPSGRTKLEIQSSNDTGLWTDQVKELSIVVLPPWYLSSIFIMLGSSLMIGIIAAIIIYRKILQERKEKLLNALVKKKTRELNKSHNRISLLLENKQRIFETVSHEIKTPITLIFNSLEMLSRNQQKALDNNEVDRIRSYAKQLLFRFEQLLSINNEQFDKEPKSLVSIKTLIDELVSEQFPSAQSKRLRFKANTSQDVLMFFDSDMLRIVFSNLLSNAIKYAVDNSEIRIVWKFDGDCLQLEFTNKCNGLRDVDIEKIFERHSRLNQHQHMSGNGLGLSIVKSILTQYGATIRAKCRTEGEITFKIRFPEKIVFSKGSEKGDKEDSHADGKSLFNSLELKPRILIVEDNDEMREFIGVFLSDEFEVSFAKDGDEGLSKFQVDNPDLVITDVMMPGKNGFELCESIRNLSKAGALVPIILITAKSDWQSQELGYTSGANDYIEKPFNGLLLRMKIANLLKIVPEVPRDFTDFALKNEVKVVNEVVDSRFIERFKSMLKSNYNKTSFNIKSMAKKLSMDERTLRRKTKQNFDEQPNVLLRNYRLACAFQMLKTDKKISAIALECGFLSTSNFSKSFKDKYGISAKEARQAEDSC